MPHQTNPTRSIHTVDSFGKEAIYRRNLILSEVSSTVMHHTLCENAGLLEHIIVGCSFSFNGRRSARM